MSSLYKSSLMMAALFFFGSSCNSQDQGGQAGLIDRKPAVAGQFYAGSPAQLRSDLARLFSQAAPPSAKNPAAVISPHAGYVFSGEVAASSFNQLDPDKKYENIFILASSHRMSFDGASIYNQGDYVTPLGKVKVNHELARKILDENPVFNDNAGPHVHEHSLEVQLPFLQYHLKTDFRIIPIIIGTQSAVTCRKIGAALKPYLAEGNLFVVSTDFSHYPEYDDAVTVDHLTAEAILANSPEILLATLDRNEKKGIPGLATSLCGWTSVLSLLYITEGNQDLEYKAVQYRNSGDSEHYGDKDRVVGYFSIVVDRKNDDPGETFSLGREDKLFLLDLARNTIVTYLKNGTTLKVDASRLSSAVTAHMGAFVTLKKDGQLRGCIGRFEAIQPLYEIVQQMAISAATADYRFKPVTPEETGELEIEISVLTPLRKIGSVDEFQPGRHGIYMKKGFATGTFLPQVARETQWTKEELLGHCARDKAGIGWDGWKDAELFVYEAYIFSEADCR